MSENARNPKLCFHFLVQKIVYKRHYTIYFIASIEIFPPIYNQPRPGDDYLPCFE